MPESDSETEIDFDHLNQYVGGDISLTKEVFGMFQNQVEMWGRMLEPNTDDDTWAAVTHSLKGAASAVGAARLARICKKSEALVGKGNKLGLRDVAVQNIEHHIARTKAEIQRWEYRQTMRELKENSG